MLKNMIFIDHHTIILIKFDEVIKIYTNSFIFS